MTIQNTAPNLFVAQEFIRSYTQVKIVHNTPVDLDIATREVWNTSNVRTSFPYTGEDFIVLTGLSEDTSYTYKFALSDDFVNASAALLDAQATNPTVLNVASYTFSTLRAPTISDVIVEEVSTGYRTAPSTITVELGTGDADFVEIQAQKQGDTEWTVVGSGETNTRAPISLSPGSYKFRVRGYIRELNEYSSWSAETSYYEVEKIGKSAFDDTVSQIIDGVDPTVPGNIYETVAGIRLDTDYLNRNSQDIEKVVFDLTNDYSVFRNENENRLAFVDKVINTQFEVNEADGTITALANQYTDTVFSQASLEIDGVAASIELNTQLIEYESDRISAAESELVLLSDQISLRTTTSEVNEIVAGAIEALTPAYSYQFNSDGEGWTGVYTHDSEGYLTQDDSVGITSPTVNFDVAVDPIVRFRIRRPVSGSGTWQGTLKLYAGDPAVDADAPDFVIPEAAENGEWATVSIDVSNYVDDPAYADPLLISQVLINTCDGCEIDFVEIGKKQSNQLQLDDITARTTTIELEMDSGTGRMAQYATTDWVDAEGYQTSTEVTASINAFDAEHSITATLELFDSNDTLNKANTAASWVDGANATIRDQVIAFNAEPDGVDDTLEGIGQSLTTINTELDAVNGKVQTNISSVYGLELDVRDAGLADILHEYNNLVNKLGIEQERIKLATATQELTALATDSEATATQVLELQTQFAESAANIVTLYEAFANDVQATAIREETLRAEITEGDAAAVAEANEYTRVSVGYCVDSNGNTVSESDAVACVGAGHSWVEGPLAEFIRNLQIDKAGNSASINDLRQVFEDVNGSLVARGGMVSDVNGKLNGWIAYNDGQSGNFDILADTFAVGNYENSVYVPKIYWDGSQLVVKGKVILGDDYEVNSETDIRALDGGYYETRYRKNPTSPSTPTGNTPSGWTVSPPVRAAGEIVWASTAFKNQAGVVQGVWSSPTEWTGDKGDTGAPGPQGPQGIQGPTGSSLYTWIAYSDSATGDTNFTNGDPGNRSHIGIAYNKSSPTESSNPNDYTWSKIEGAQGPQGPQGTQGPQGPNGESLYTWIAYSDSATGDTNFTNGAPGGRSYIGIAYNKTIPTESNTPGDYTWTLIKGTDGTNGTNGTDGTDGDTIYTEFQFSSDGTNWHFPEQNGDIYLRSRTVTNGSPSAWGNTTNLKGDQGEPGQNVTVQDNGNGTYTITGSNGNVVVSDGADAPIPVVEDLGGGDYRISVNGNSVTWSDGAPGTNGTDGVDGVDGHTPVLGIDYFYNGRFYSSVYKVASSTPSTPSGGSFNGTSETVPTSWSDSPVYTEGQTTYVSTAVYTQHPNTGNWSRITTGNYSPNGWSSPKPYIIKGNDGDPGADGDNAILYSLTTTIGLPSSGSTITRSFNSSYSGPALLSINATDMEGDVQVGLNATEIATLPSANNETRWYHFNVEVVSGTNNIDFYGASTFGRVINEIRVSVSQAGDRGAGRYEVGTSTGAWSDTTANNTVPGRTPVQDDVVTIYKTSDPSVQETRRFNNGSWTSFALHIHGDALIEGTLQADRLVAGSITADRIDSNIVFSETATFEGTVYAKSIQGDVADIAGIATNSASYTSSSGGLSEILALRIDSEEFDRTLIFPTMYFQYWEYADCFIRVQTSNDGVSWITDPTNFIFINPPTDPSGLTPSGQIVVNIPSGVDRYVRFMADKTTTSSNGLNPAFSYATQTLALMLFKKSSSSMTKV